MAFHFKGSCHLITSLDRSNTEKQRLLMRIYIQAEMTLSPTSYGHFKAPTQQKEVHKNKNNNLPSTKRSWLVLMSHKVSCVLSLQLKGELGLFFRSELQESVPALCSRAFPIVLLDHNDSPAAKPAETADRQTRSGPGRNRKRNPAEAVASVGPGLNTSCLLTASS